MLQKSPGLRTCGHTRHRVWQCSGHQHWLLWGNTYFMCLSSLLAECCLNSANKGSLRLVIICSALLWELGKWYYLPSTFQNAWCVWHPNVNRGKMCVFFFCPVASCHQQALPISAYYAALTLYSAAYAHTCKCIYYGCIRKPGSRKRCT